MACMPGQTWHNVRMDLRRVPFDDLADADLHIDRIYGGGTTKTFADDPIGKLLPVGNQGGFRYNGSVLAESVRIVVLFTSGDEVDWPDRLDPATGDFTYYGDNRRPGHELHETPRRGNLLLKSIFSASRSGPEERKHVPPIFLFEKTGSGRDVTFRGLLAPGSPRLNAEEELVATWRTTANVRFQNYRGHFTVLSTPTVTREWINDVLAGDPLGMHCPREWRTWVQSRIYQALEAPPTVTVRSKAEQLPVNVDEWIIEMIHKHFAAQPEKFEHLAAELWVASDTNVTHVEVTRPSRDGGRDAIGGYRIGIGKDPIVLDFAMEAKCYAMEKSVGTRDVARLISRIRHRQFGIFLTTSYIANQTYREVREDGHPVVFISAVDIVAIVKKMGYDCPESLLAFLTSKHPVDHVAGKAGDVSYGNQVDIRIGDQDTIQDGAVDSSVCPQEAQEEQEGHGTGS